MRTFQEQFAPITFRIGFLEAPLQTVAEALSSWRNEHFQSVAMDRLIGGMTEVLPRLAPLTMPPRRSLVAGTNSPWTAYFDNSILGSDAFGPIGYLSEIMGCCGVITTNVPHTLNEESGREKGSYGAVQFEMFGPETDNLLGYVRSVSVAFDGGKWRFDANGGVQSFETVECYKERRVVDRFTVEMLKDYCSALGIRVFDREFYANEAYLVSVGDTLPNVHRELSLAEARAELGVLN